MRMQKHRCHLMKSKVRLVKERIPRLLLMLRLQPLQQEELLLVIIHPVVVVAVKVVLKNQTLRKRIKVKNLNLLRNVMLILNLLLIKQLVLLKNSQMPQMMLGEQRNIKIYLLSISNLAFRLKRIRFSSRKLAII